MSEKKRMTTWVPTTVMGVVAILFSVYALQEQTELHQAKEELNALKAEIANCQKKLAEQIVITASAEEKARIADEAAQVARAEAEILSKKTSRNR